MFICLFVQSYVRSVVLRVASSLFRFFFVLYLAAKVFFSFQNEPACKYNVSNVNGFYIIARQMILNDQIFVYFFLIIQIFSITLLNSTTIHEINEAVFLDPRTHSAVIRCPLDFTHSADIQSYDVANHRYEPDRGRYYRINGTQPFDREFICSTISQTGAGSDEKYRMKIRTYGKIKRFGCFFPLINIKQRSQTLA